LAAGRRTDPLEELTALPKHPSWILRGPTTKGRRGQGRREEGREGEGKERRGMRGDANMHPKGFSKVGAYGPKKTVVFGLLHDTGAISQKILQGHSRLPSLYQVSSKSFQHLSASQNIDGSYCNGRAALSCPCGPPMHLARPLLRTILFQRRPYVSSSVECFFFYFLLRYFTEMHFFCQKYIKPQSPYKHGYGAKVKVNGHVIRTLL